MSDIITGRIIVSAPGAVIQVTRIEVSDEWKAAVTAALLKGRA